MLQIIDLFALNTHCLAFPLSAITMVLNVVLLIIGFFTCEKDNEIITIVDKSEYQQLMKLFLTEI